MNPRNDRLNERRVIVGDRERPVDEPALDPQPTDDLMVLQPTEGQPVARAAYHRSDGTVKSEYPLSVAPLPHDRHLTA